MQFDSKERLAGEFADAFAGRRDAQNVPDVRRVAGTVLAGSHDTTALRRSWPGRVIAFVRNAAVGLLLVTAAPIVAVGVRGHEIAVNTANTKERLADAERMRVLAAPVDAAITPAAAGDAFRNIQNPKSTPEFPARQVAAHDASHWETRALTSTMFASRTPAGDAPSPRTIVADAAKGLNAQELAYLRTVAESPVWNDFDRVATAPAVDVLGGLYQLPFRSEASSLSMPLLKFANTKDLALAGELRAAYYLATGQEARAELALRSIVSFGFVLVDNGTNELDALIGRMIMNIGRDGLEQFYAATGGAPASLADALKRVSMPAYTREKTNLPSSELHARLIRDAADAGLARGVRYASLQGLSFSTCGTVRGMLFGMDSKTHDAFQKARVTLARFPSEQAYIDMMEDSPNRVPDTQVKSAPARVMMGAAMVAATVLQNPRVEACTRLALSFR